MPFRFVCHSCGRVLHEELLTASQLRRRNKKSYVEQVVEKLGGECRFCGAKLHTLPLKVEIKTQFKKTDGFVLEEEA